MKARAKIWAVSAILAASAPGLAFANNECTSSGPWNVQFTIDATNLEDDLVADTTDTVNVSDFKMPDIAAGTKGWNACFNSDSTDQSSVTVVYSHAGENNFQIEYIVESEANDFEQDVKYKWLSSYRYYIDYNAKANTLTLIGKEID
jgi:hypothetical protein